MILFSPNIITEYGITGGGNYFESKKTTKGQMFRSTPSAQKFLQWVTQSEVLFCDEVKQQIKRKNGNNNN